jgi:glycosyltransferase involved in cell wall biosynthesis
MEKIKLNICSHIGSPVNPRTWSGTPFHLCSELEKQGRLCSTIHSSAINNIYSRAFVSFMNKLYYGNSIDPNRGCITRYLNAQKVKNKTSTSESKLTLHTGTFDLPFLKFPVNQKHYLYCDATWDSKILHSTCRGDYTKKMLKDAEELEMKAYSQVEHIFSTSKYVKDNLITHYRIKSQKITVVGTGLGVIKPYFGQKNYSNNKILFVAKGQFEDKGGDLALEAFTKALKSNPELELIIIGQNKYTKKINLPRVKTYGFIPIEELQNIFNECSLFLMPALNEPWGLVYLEALACKMPIIGLNRNSFPELSDYGKYGFGLNEINPIQLSEILIDAFRHPQKLAEIGKNGQKYCLENFSWHNTVSKIIQTIEDEL